MYKSSKVKVQEISFFLLKNQIHVLFEFIINIEAFVEFIVATWGYMTSFLIDLKIKKLNSVILKL